MLRFHLRRDSYGERTSCGSSPVGEERSASFDFKSIFAGGKIGLELSLSSQDRELIGNHLTELQEKVEETSRKVDYRWKVTQWIMGIGITLGCYRTGGIVDISLIRAIAGAFCFLLLALSTYAVIESARLLYTMYKEKRL